MQDLCERHEKGVVSEHQKTIQKLNQYKKKTNAVYHSHSAVSQNTSHRIFIASNSTEVLSLFMSFQNIVILSVIVIVYAII